LLAKLQGLQINVVKYDHPVVLTVEEQAKYVGNMKGALSVNLFLKDKKHRYYIVSAMTDTKVDLKILSQRLGLGKGGIRMAPKEALQEILQVPEGCATPFAIVNETARHVSVLLDQRFKSQECCFFHPLSNDSSISLNTTDLDKFFKSIGKELAYVDLLANPVVGKDQPPDLAALVPSDAPVLSDIPAKTDSVQTPEPNHVKAVKVPKKEKSNEAVVKVSSSYSDPEKFVEEILEKATSIVISEVKEENVKQHGDQLGDFVSKSITKHLQIELKNLATMFKNTAYAEGFYAGTHCQPKRL
jgi:hypothetical protein